MCGILLILLWLYAGQQRPDYSCAAVESTSAKNIQEQDEDVPVGPSVKSETGR